jgi:DNA-binding CsgD family transcriptional regulator
MQLLFASAPTPMGVFELQSLAFVTLNDAAVAFYGYSPQAFQDMTFSDLYGISVRAALGVQLQALRVAHHFAGSTAHQLADGSEIPLQLKADMHVIFGVEAVLFFAQPDTKTHDAFDLKLDKLTSRERQILHLVGQGYTNRQVADEFTISIRTVETHCASLLRKLELVNRAALILFAVAHFL